MKTIRSEIRDEFESRLRGMDEKEEELREAKEMLESFKRKTDKAKKRLEDLEMTKDDQIMGLKARIKVLENEAEQAKAAESQRSQLLIEAIKGYVGKNT